MEPIHLLLAQADRSVDQQATRRARTDPRATFDPSRLSGSQGVTPSLKVSRYDTSNPFRGGQRLDRKDQHDQALPLQEAAA